MKKLFIIAGCNGAGKTTASYTILPAILNCTEFVNADEIAKGISPFQPEKVSIQAGRLMLIRIRQLLEAKTDFALETTLSTKSYKGLIEKAKEKGYQVVLLFFWLSSADLAVKRVEMRVKEGGHNIPEDVIRRRYEKGLSNFFKMYKPIVDKWMLINNSGYPYRIIAGNTSKGMYIKNEKIWTQLNRKYNEK